MEIDFKKNLNEDQFKAVTAPDGPILALAAAGTGKTRTLVYRVAYLVKQGISLNRILLLTFTNRAANEMLERVQKIINTGTNEIWGGTFHHIANRIMRRHASAIGYDTNYTILDRDDSRTLIGKCLKELNLKDKEFPKRDVLLSIFSYSANMERSLQNIIESRFADFLINTEDILRVHKTYNKKKKKLDAMDFDDMLVNCLKLFRENSDILKIYQDRFQHLLVDEYQDTNFIQAELIDMLAESSKSLFVVGDDFQSIYSWRGADFRNIMSFPERYQNTFICKLETNYRSVPEILNVANVCISGNPDQFQKTLHPSRKAYKKPIVTMIRDGHEQARYILDMIKRLCRNEGYKRSDIAILYRSHYHAMELQMLLSKEGMPYIITSGVRFFEQAHIKDVCSILRVLIFHEDELAFFRLICLLPGVGEKTAAKIWKVLNNKFNPLNPDNLKSIRSVLRPSAHEAWNNIEKIFISYEKDELYDDGGEIIYRFLHTFYERYAINTYDNYKQRIDDINELIFYMAKFESIQIFLSDIALMTNLDAESETVTNSDSNMLHLTTIHQAKGLEWSVVIILWLTEGMFPSSRAMNESVFTDTEERRLFYVAITRAKNELCLCVPEIRRTRDGGVIYYQPSRFVEEIPENMIQKVRPGFI